MHDIFRIRIVLVIAFAIWTVGSDLYAQASLVSGSISNSITNYSVGPGKNRLIVVAVESRKGGGIDATSITWGGQLLVQASEQVSVNSNLQVEIWYLDEAGIVAATAGAVWCRDFAVTWSAAPTNERFVAFTLKDVNQVSPVSDFDGANDTGSSTIALPSISVAVNDLVCYAAGINSNETHTSPVGYTEITEQSGGNPTMAVATKEIATAGTENPTATFSANGQVFIAGVVFSGLAASGPTTYYSLASGAWNLNTTWSLTSDGSSGAVPVGVWPTREDNVVIRTGHNVTINATDNNQSCGMSPDALGLANVGPFTSSNIDMFYHTGDIVIEGTLSVTNIEAMLGGYTHIFATGTLTLNSNLVQLGFLEADQASTLNSLDDLVLTGNSTTIINTNSTNTDNLVIDHTDATLCGTGVNTLQNGAGSKIDYTNLGSISQVCTSFTIACVGVGCSGFPAIGTGSFFSGITGPGGVGNLNTNEIWLMADQDAYTDAGSTLAVNSNTVRQWHDKSGNGRDAFQNTSANRPIYRTGQENGMPALQFTGDLFVDSPSLGIAGTSDLTYFVIFRDTQTGVGGINDGSGDYILDRTLATNPLMSLKPISGNIYALQKRDNAGAGLGGPASTTLINTNIKWIEMARDKGTAYNFFYDGILENTVADGDGDLSPSPLRIGRHATTANGGLRGFIHELFVYSSIVNNAQRILINNYLSAKYAMPLSVDDVYTMDNPVNGDYDSEVAGIGRASDGSYHKDAKGNGVVRMWNPKDLDNDEFLMWGHDNVVLNSSATAIGTAVDGTLIQVWLARIWRVSEVGDVGRVSISFDLSGLGGSPLGSNLRLLIDRDGDGFADNDVTPISGSVSNGIVVFSNVNFQNGDRFTLGNTDSSSPLPIELIMFKATPERDAVKLNWKTASEFNNDYFSVERSLDGEQWQLIGTVTGAGTTREENTYESMDYQPIRGVSYYRLRQTDFDGKISFSHIERVDFAGQNLIQVFPNPSEGIFYLVNSTQLDVESIRVVNSLGQQVFPLIKKGDTISIDLNSLSQGIYILQVWNGTFLSSVRLVKRN
ncbi:hypothetical protein MASR2M41_19190 [Flammeovirgaceae bacterium]